MKRSLLTVLVLMVALLALGGCQVSKANDDALIAAIINTGYSDKAKDEICSETFVYPTLVSWDSSSIELDNDTSNAKGNSYFAHFTIKGSYSGPLLALPDGPVYEGEVDAWGDVHVKNGEPGTVFWYIIKATKEQVE